MQLCKFFGHGAVFGVVLVLLSSMPTLSNLRAKKFFEKCSAYFYIIWFWFLFVILIILDIVISVTKDRCVVNTALCCSVVHVVLMLRKLLMLTSGRVNAAKPAYDCGNFFPSGIAI